MRVFCMASVLHHTSFLTTRLAFKLRGLSKAIRLACDASPYGVGAVISQVEKDGQERPVVFASRSLSTTEKQYAQIERKALALILGVKKFHQYLYGRAFTLQTDHKPLMTILWPKTAIPMLAAACMQRWALILSAYQYNIEYRKSSDNANEDAMSRLPAGTAKPEEDNGIYLCSFMPIRAKEIHEATRIDPILSQVLKYTLEGWPAHLSQSQSELKPYLSQKEHLSVEQSCVLFGYRVIVPTTFQDRLFNELHSDHPGMCRIKALARCYVWWPSLNKDIESKVKSCSVCRAVQNTPQGAPLHPWQYPSRIWQDFTLILPRKEEQFFWW